MVIKKTSEGVAIEALNSKALISITEKSLGLRIEGAQMTVEVSKAGEYEYQEIGVTALELTKDKYQNIINFLKLSIENVNIGFVTSELPIDKELFKDLGNLDILVISNADNIDFAKKLANYLDVLYVLILEAKDVEAVKKSLGLASLVEEKVVKLKSSDMRRGEDDNAVINGYALR